MTSFEKRRGRLITVEGFKWKWFCGKRCGVIAYREDGHRIFDRAANIKFPYNNSSYDIFSEGQWNGDKDGMLTQKDISKWLGCANHDIKNHGRTFGK